MSFVIPPTKVEFVDTPEAGPSLPRKSFHVLINGQEVAVVKGGVTVTGLSGDSKGIQVNISLLPTEVIVRAARDGDVLSGKTVGEDPF